ncbi:MAG: aldo/keto reductase [Candidatus Competibacterales bacterium]
MSAALPPRPLGATPLQVSALGLGLAALGRPAYINMDHGHDLRGVLEVDALERRVWEVLDAARGAGIRYVDAARSYGRAEYFLGRWLKDREVAKDALTVGSKWGYTYTANWQVDAPVHEVKEHSLTVLRRHWQESRAYLKDHLDLYQIHSVTPESDVLTRLDVLRELLRLKASGVALGLSVSGPHQAQVLRRALAIQADGVRLFDAVQVTWNPLEPSCAPLLAEARARGMGVIVKEALANGRLTPRNQAPPFALGSEALDRQAARLGVTRDVAALAAALARPWVDVVLSGAASVEQLRANLKALEVTWDAEAEAALGGLAEPVSHYWRLRSQLPWN